jgi:hypothetical protein
MNTEVPGKNESTETAATAEMTAIPVENTDTSAATTEMPASETSSAVNTATSSLTESSSSGEPAATESSPSTTPDNSFLGSISSSFASTFTPTNGVEDKDDSSGSKEEFKAPFDEESVTDYKHANIHKKNSHLERISSFNSSLKGHGDKYYKKLDAVHKRTMKKKIVDNLVGLLHESVHKKYENTEQTRRLKRILKIKNNLDKHFSLIFNHKISKRRKTKKGTRQDFNENFNENFVPKRGIKRQSPLYGSNDFEEDRDM